MKIVSSWGWFSSIKCLSAAVISLCNHDLISNLSSTSGSSAQLFVFTHLQQFAVMTLFPAIRSFHQRSKDQRRSKPSLDVWANFEEMIRLFPVF